MVSVRQSAYDHYRTSLVGYFIYMSLHVTSQYVMKKIGQMDLFIYQALVTQQINLYMDMTKPKMNVHPLPLYSTIL